jgi:hypothetical protein
MDKSVMEKNMVLIRSRYSWWQNATKNTGISDEKLSREPTTSSRDEKTRTSKSATIAIHMIMPASGTIELRAGRLSNGFDKTIATLMSTG